MKTGVWPRLWLGVRGLTPFAVTLALTFLNVVPLRLPGFAPVTPELTLAAVYFWSIYRPDLLPLVATFAVGIVEDALCGTPLGLTSLTLLFVQGVVVSQRRFFHGKAFLLEWWGLMLLAPAAMLVHWLLASAYYGMLLAPEPVAVRLLLTVALYPLLTWLFAAAQHYLLRPS